MRLLIAGCGYVGSELARQLMGRGHRVWGLRRSAAPLPEGVERVAADVSRFGTLRDLPGELDGVVYAVGADRFDEAAYRSVYVEGPGNLLKALDGKSTPAVRFVLVSSTGVYGQRDGDWVDERSPTGPAGFSGEILLEGERHVLATDPGACVVRLGGLYGPGRVLLVDRLRAGEATCTEDPPQYLNLVHRDDAAGILGHLLTLRKPPQIVLGVDDEPVDRCVILRWLAHRVGAPPPEVTTAENGGGSSRRPSNKRCSNRLLHRTGYELRYPTWREGYADLVPPANVEEP